MLGTVPWPEVQTLTPFVEGQTLWPQGAHYRYHRGGHDLARVVHGVEDDHVEAMERGEAEFAVVLVEPLIVFCSRFGTALPWLGGSFHWQRVPRPERGLPALGPDLGTGVPLHIALVESKDGRVRAARTATLSSEFTRVLHEAILEQARFSYDPIAERRALDGLLRRYPSVGVLVAHATVRCTSQPGE